MADSDIVDRWQRVIRTTSRPELRLVCFPQAGGAASFFHPWAAHLPATVELIAVRYPGREDRLADPPAEHMADLVGPIARGCAGLRDVPLAFFGHSMGAIVAYEVALRLQRSTDAPLARLFVSGCAAPGHEKDRQPSDLSDSGLTSDLERMGGTDPAALGHPELRELILSTLRTDYRLLDEHRLRPAREMVSAPLTAYYGTDDEDLDATSVGAWSDFTRADFAIRAFPGGHFYLADQVRALLADLFSHISLMSHR